MNPNDILGVSEHASRHEIQCAYRTLLRLLHPDKIRHSGFTWSEDEQREAYHQCREAYRSLMEPFDEINVPDYDLEYEDVFAEDSAVTQPSFDVDQFNKNFDAHQELIQSKGLENPWDVGGWNKIEKGEEALSTTETILGLTKPPLLTAKLGNKNAVVGTDIQKVYFSEEKGPEERATFPERTLEEYTKERDTIRESFKFEDENTLLRREQKKWEKDIERANAQRDFDLRRSQLRLRD